MTALSANKERRIRNDRGMRKEAYTPATSTQFYEGGLVALNGSGLLVPASDSAGFRVVGVCTTKVLSASSSPAKVEVETGHEEWFPIDSALNTAIATSTEKAATVADDTTLSNAATTTNDIPAGVIKDYESWRGVNGVWLHMGAASANGPAG